jgi:hypothetical protein
MHLDMKSTLKNNYNHTFKQTYKAYEMINLFHEVTGKS